MMHNTNNIKNSRLNIEEILFLLGILLKPFYILPSGSLQAGDILMFLGIARHFNYFRTRALGISIEDKQLFIFVALIMLINGIYFSLYMSVSFLMATFYYIFNFFVVVVFGQLMYNMTFLLTLEKVLKLNLIVQFAIYLAGKGKWYFRNYRYMGTFNDPNQYGFFIFASFLLICLINSMSGKVRKSLVWYLFSVYLMSFSASTGMLMGFGLFIVLYIIFSLDLNRAAIVKWLCVLVAVCAVLFMLNQGIIKLPDSVTQSFMYKRLVAKTDNISESSNDLVKDRAWNKVFNYPDRLLYGAGEGFYQRFDGSGSEVHSSILAPLWYYGIIPCSFWFSWCFRKIRGVKKELWCVYLALILESVTLVHNRQPFFWMIFVLAGHLMNKKADLKDENGLVPK